ncbi:hypothetical protein PV10_01670 [Exophiala mesophila]|uniref:glucan endo-1,3-beta-D-glucosidase n=1 Tax=Exophiala mesophila TaxID=212818 RepID=A0A0D1X7X0_EXOME|nr:uncharacterized protein PV10_01670 [Exophiala mesophila]KIV97975.1 hypothetical protein PV10_01670 [Exophiala mesophila]
MHTSWAPVVLTLSQAFLAGALPARRVLGQSKRHFERDCDCDDQLYPFGDDTLTSPITVTADGETFIRGPPWQTSLVSDLLPTLQPTTNNDAATSTQPSSPLETSTISTESDQSYGPSTSPTLSAAETTGSSAAPSTIASPTYTSEITYVNPNLSFGTATITDLPSSQDPTATSAANPNPDTTGFINTTLQTGGRPPVQPFPTGNITVSSPTLEPLDSTAPFGTDTATESPSSITETLTLPVTTFETVVVNSTIVNIPVPTTTVVTAITVINTTVTSDGSLVSTSTVGTTVITTSGTAIIETMISASSTITETEAITLTTDVTASVLPTATSTCLLPMGCSGQDLFQPVGLGSPPANIGWRDDHPVPRLGINTDGGPIETNKFYQNIVLGSQTSPVFMMPYSLRWSKGSGNARSWGLAISHIDNNQKAYGPANPSIPGSPSSFYINPLGIESIILSAAELGPNTVMTSDSLLAFSANVHLQPAQGSASILTLPLVQGMAFVTAHYADLQPEIQSSVFFRNIAAAVPPKPGVYKYRVTLEDGKIWLIYAIPSSGVSPNLLLLSSTMLQGIPNWFGDIQIAKLPDPSLESYYDDAVGAYPTAGHVSGNAQGTTAQYSLSWTKGGAFASNTSLLMFALPHHVQSFESSTLRNVTNLVLTTPTKGEATAVVGDYWVLEETELPTSMAFAPWRPGSPQAQSTLSPAAIAAIQGVAAAEASQNMSAQSNLNSMYFSGKALSKFATLIYTMHDLSDQQDLARAALLELEDAFDVFARNQQEFPLVYDTVWKGLVSSASYVLHDDGVDFGNSYYNDHHFHYGYFIHAASVIGYLDPTWLTRNKDYVNALVRDIANPSSLDQYFPVSRAFDWYHGHSWAKGLFESGDGKDEESSSEDAMFAYSLKMWGRTIGDASMEARGNLMLSVMARSFQNYFLMESDNPNQPASFIDNKVTGILFENKADHVTYFGTDLSYVQGIHMIPVMPCSTLTRKQSFVLEEWIAYFADGAVRQVIDVQGGWRGIIMANLAIINPQAAFNFFTTPNFDMSWIDGGASLTWYIALSAMLGGSP